MTAEKKAAEPGTANPTWKPVAGSEQDTHSQTPGGGQEQKHGTKDSAESRTAHSATRKGEEG